MNEPDSLQAHQGQKFSRWTRALIGCGLAALLSACVGYVAHPPADIPNGKQTYKDEVNYLGRDYLLSPGDELEIIYHTAVELQNDYRLAIGDQIRVEFFDAPQFDRTLDVRPDGRVTVPFIGDLDAFGLTPTELAKRVDGAYSQLLRNPKSTVTLIRYGQRIRDLKDAIKTAARGQSRLSLVGPDGRITLPLIKPILVAGKTIDQAEREIEAAYGRVVPGIQTSSVLLNAKGNIVYVYGAVLRPGFFELRGPTTVTQAIAMAGGFTPASQAASTLLITRNEEHQAVGRLIDIANIMDTGNIGKDTLLRQSDVVFVPNTRLSEAALVGNFIRSMIPVNLGFTYGLQQNVLPDIRLY
ncbi:MAG: polysaccharide biosynthesis/export family protein [Dechloromonas sp.]|nr:polysaccharide biosynthesis/export family protein [Dechloromonas sp.]